MIVPPLSVPPIVPSVAPVTDPLPHSETVITVGWYPNTPEETCENDPSTQSSIPVHKLDPRVSYSVSVGTLNMDLTTGPQETVPPPQISE